MIVGVVSTGETAKTTFMVLTAEPAAARAARDVLTRRCGTGQIPADVTDTARLLTSELVTNAVIHGRSAVTLSVRLTQRLLRVEVSDDNSRHPRLEDYDKDALDGRGLHIVDYLAHDWGVTDHQLGKTVWFELALGGPRDSHASPGCRHNTPESAIGRVAWPVGCGASLAARSTPACDHSSDGQAPSTRCVSWAPWSLPAVRRAPRGCLLRRSRAETPDRPSPPGS